MYDCTNKKPQRNNHLLQEEDNHFSFYINDVRTAMIRVDFQVHLPQLLRKPSRWSTSAFSAVRTISHSLLLLKALCTNGELPPFISIRTEHSGQLFVRPSPLLPQLSLYSAFTSPPAPLSSPLKAM